MCRESIQVKYARVEDPYGQYPLYTYIYEVIKINKLYSFFLKKQADQQIELEKGIRQALSEDERMEICSQGN